MVMNKEWILNHVRIIYNLVYTQIKITKVGEDEIRKWFILSYFLIYIYI